MTLIRIFALSLLLGAALTGLVWFTWGAVAGALKRAPAQNAVAGSKPGEKEGPAKKPA